jgi:hypothetical protein
VAAGGAGSGAAANQRLAEVAAASTSMARTAEQQRRQDKADRQARGANGRFGSGDRARAGSELAGTLGAGAGAAVAGAGRIDPVMGALAEAGGLFGSVKNAAVPVGRAFGGLFGRRGGRDGERSPEVGWLRRMWRELRLMRRDEAKTSRETLAELKNAGGGGSDGGGIMGLVMGLLRGPVMAVAGVAFAAIAGWFTGGALYKWFVSLNLGEKFGAAWDGAVAIVKDVFEPARQLFSDLGAWLSKLPGMQTGKDLLGKAADAAKNMASAAPEAIKGGVAAAVDAAADVGKKALGWVSKQFESGKGGAGTVSSGKGDAGGASYGTHQLASKTGTLQKFLATSGYGAQFEGLTPGTPAFNAKWKQIAATDPGFAGAQHDFIKTTHFDPQMAKLKRAGIDLSGRGSAVKEAVFSTSTQFGGNTDLIQRALAGRDAASMSDADIISAVQDYKMASNASRFRSSDAGTRAAVLKRAASEKATLLALSAKEGGVASPSMPALPRLPTGAPVVVAAAPSLEAAGPTRVNSAPATTTAPAAPAAISQDVRDRTIAHIVTGGIGGVTSDR